MLPGNIREEETPRPPLDLPIAQTPNRRFHSLCSKGTESHNHWTFLVCLPHGTQSFSGSLAFRGRNRNVCCPLGSCSVTEKTEPLSGERLSGRALVRGSILRTMMELERRVAHSRWRQRVGKMGHVTSCFCRSAGFPSRSHQRHV